MSDCIFCKLVEGKIPSTRIYEDENVIGFKDLRPQAQVHHLFIHRRHTRDIIDLVSCDPDQLGDLFRAIATYTAKESLTREGFRLVTNLGPDAGQTVFHTHFHVLAGEQLGSFGA